MKDIGLFDYAMIDVINDICGNPSGFTVAIRPTFASGSNLVKSASLDVKLTDKFPEAEATLATVSANNKAKNVFTVFIISIFNCLNFTYFKKQIAFLFN